MRRGDDHLGDAIQDLLDGRLVTAERDAAEAHLASCPACRAERDALARARAIVSSAAAGPVALPAGLEQRIAAALDAEDAPPAPRRGPLRAALAIAAVVLIAALAVVTVVTTRRPSGGPLVAGAAADLAAIGTGTMSIELPISDPPALEQAFADHGLDFHTRVFDLGMMGFELVGGRIARIDGRPSALFVYRGADGGLMICEMFRGKAADLPAADAVRLHAGMRFRVFRRGAATLVFWQEGDVICVLAAEGDAETVVQLAFAKAAKV